MSGISSECAWTASSTLPLCGVPWAGRSRTTLAGVSSALASWAYRNAEQLQARLVVRRSRRVASGSMGGLLEIRMFLRISAADHSLPARYILRRRSINIRKLARVQQHQAKLRQPMLLGKALSEG